MLPIVVHDRQVPAWGYFTQLVARVVEGFEFDRIVGGTGFCRTSYEDVDSINLQRQVLFKMPISASFVEVV